MDPVTREMLTGLAVGLVVSAVVIATGLLLGWSHGAIGGVYLLTVGPALLFTVDHFEKPRRRREANPRR